MNQDRYSRQSFLGKSSQAIFESVTVGVVGLGGGGSHVVQQLTHIGFKRYELFDADVVDESNLNRLVSATVEDAADENKRTKCFVAERRIRSLQPNAIINSNICNWQQAMDSLKRCHLVFGCVDSFLDRDQLERFTRRYLIAYIDIGMDVNIGTDGQLVMGGQVITSLPGCACMRCMGFITDDLLSREAQKYGDAGDRPQVVWPNSVLASTDIGIGVGVGVGVGLLTNWTQSAAVPVYLEYDGTKSTIRDLSSRFENKPCQHYKPQDVGEVVFSLRPKQEIGLWYKIRKWG